MGTGMQTWTEEIVEAAGTKVRLFKGGSGEPLLVLHDELGHHGWFRYHEALAKQFTLYVPSHAGFGKSEGLDWIMNTRDLAGWYLHVLDDMGLGPVNVMGFSFGGWLAAEMATMCPQQFKKLALVGAMGIRPPVGEIMDMFLIVARDYLGASVLYPGSTPEFKELCPDEPTPELVEAWELARYGASRLGWRPYMHYPGLPHLLRRLKGLPTIVIWGRQDAVVPLSAAEVYHQAIPGSRLAVLDDCGHRPEIERPDEFVSLVREFFVS